MSKSLKLNDKNSGKYDIQGAEKELIEQLAEAENYSNEQCMDYKTFSKQLRVKLNERI